MRILVLDDLSYYMLKDIQEVFGVPIDFVAEADSPALLSPAMRELYDPSTDTLDWISQQTNFDIVILGNNIKAGLKKGPYIPLELKAKTIVVWTKLTEQETIPYRELGFSHFSQRVGVEQEIRKLIET